MKLSKKKTPRRAGLMFGQTFALMVMILYLLLLCGQVFASEKQSEPESELSRVLECIKKKEKTLKTFTATFRQIKKTYLLNEPLTSEGLIYFDSSGKLLMKVTSPSPLLILFKNSSLLVYYPEIAKAEKRYIGNAESIFKEYFGIAQPVEALKQQYDIQLSSETHSDGYVLKMIPKIKDIAKHIDRIEVFVNPETWLPERIFFTEVKGDRTELWLQFTAVNQPLPPGIFSIILPVTDDRDR
ncbi:MAG: outer membrane lipoprotein carrier protein LolA [Pseudomonadota bacterium]